MGAWGYGHFEDDSALDFMADIEESSHPKNVIKKAFEQAIAADYIESDEGNAVVVAAAYVDGQINGTKFSEEGQSVPLSIDTFVDRHRDIDLSDLRKNAVLALNKVLGENSELKELWAENDEDFPRWTQGIQLLIKRLEK
ncbi:DUF4259 domain-containing protein [Chryseolinea sp. H1M3-3]|uniref:DUF4259 domain-containing protein n=1 Tax=Chryseolinea sp. H1M3-3 TaxID=3034144 RepID=UPI0023ED8AE7|nr:DUF4259 domain-containing protein [Chryseolinea sp. H1M3-3]